MKSRALRTIKEPIPSPLDAKIVDLIFRYAFEYRNMYVSTEMLTYFTYSIVEELKNKGIIND
ncbi:MAG: hypothetical protein Q8P20_01095 [bacterium]|nr:hypothetical protein [bacterium]